MKVTLFTAPGHTFNFAMTLVDMKSRGSLNFPHLDLETIREIDPKTLDRIALKDLSEGKEVVIDGNALRDGMEGLGYMPHEYLARLHMVVEPPGKEPEVIDCFVGQAIDLISTQPEP